MTTATTPRTDDLTALDWDLPCEFGHDCTAPADWHVTIAVIDDHGHVWGRAHDFLCDVHKTALVGHVATCGNCPRLFRIESVEAIR